ncbi:MAG: hypothetical protein BGO39_20855 [Chloroflexi bacterium 54-19]|nr:MAG: hypothetical protein BGO39_20855 [Chloroflexi bacterium 54-19]
MIKNISRKKFIQAGAAFLFGSLTLAACGEEGQISPAPGSTSLIPEVTATIPGPTTLAATKVATSQTTSGQNSTAGASITFSPTNEGVPSPTLEVPTTTSPASTTRAPVTQPAQTALKPTQAPPTATFNSANLDITTKVGQRLLVVFPGTELTQSIKNFILTVKPGGILLFADNISSLAQVKKLIADLQTLAEQNGLPRFIITLDEEGGIVSRMPQDGREGIAPSQMAQAAGGLEAVQTCAHETAARLADLGFNLNLAPVGDVNSNYKNPVIGTRSFGSDPDKVAQAVRVAVAEYLAQKVGTCVKHFPGHGGTDVDSHTGLPVVRKNRAQLDEIELKPFKEAIAAGTPAIMTAHILFPLIEPNNLPATLSPYFLKKLLREELNFQGLIITDSLSMGAISNRYGLAEAARLSLVAGADMVIAISDLAGQQAVFKSLVTAAQRGDFETDKPVERIINFKSRFAGPNSAALPQDTAKILAAAQKSITLLRAGKLSSPLVTNDPLLVNLALAQPSQVEGQPPSTILGELWQAKFPNQPVIEVSTDPTAGEIDRVLRQAKKASQVVLITRDAYDNSEQLKLVQALLTLGPPLLVVAVRGPYDLLAFPKATGYLLSYSDTPASIRALVDALTGNIPINGKLPVSIPGLYEVGAGLQLPVKGS